MKFTFKFFSHKITISEDKGPKVHFPPEILNIIVGYLTQNYVIPMGSAPRNLPLPLDVVPAAESKPEGKLRTRF
jgi:hypothetical protein